MTHARRSLLAALLIPMLASALPAEARRDRISGTPGASVTQPDLRLPLGDDLPRSLPTPLSNAPWFDVRMQIVRNGPHPMMLRDAVVPVQIWQRQFVDPGALHPQAFVREVRPTISCLPGTWLCGATSVQVRDSALSTGVAAAVVYLGLDDRNDLRLSVAVEGLVAVGPGQLQPTRLTVRNIPAREGREERVVLGDGTMLVLTIHQRGPRTSF